ncbi:MAG: heavy-metal-associated domain-containing protein, partial [Planctomycetales bacterium]
TGRTTTMNRRNFLILGTALTLGVCRSKTAQAAQPEYTWIFVKDMHCSNCAQKIARKLYNVGGVVKVQTDVNKNVAVVTPQPGINISPRSLWEAIEKAEFLPVKLQGPNGTYTRKPSS